MDRGDIAFLNFRRGVRVARRQWVSTLPDPYFIAAKFFIYKRGVMKDATSLPFHSVHSVQHETNISTHGQFHHSRGRVDALRGILPLQHRHQLSHCPQPVPYRWKHVLDLFAPDQQEYPVVRDICFFVRTDSGFNLAAAARSTKSPRSVHCSHSPSAKTVPSLTRSTRSVLKETDPLSLLHSLRARSPS